jgi:hypothetical protein
MRTIRVLVLKLFFLFVLLECFLEECVAVPVIVVVSGHPGDFSFGTSIGEMAKRWEEAASRSGAEWRLVSAQEEGGGESQKSRIRSALSAVTASDSEPVWVVLNGHGNAQGRVPRFALTGEDLGADELKEMLAPIKRPVVLVLGFAGSGAFVKSLAAKDRILLSATRSGAEENWTRFGQFFSQAIIDPAADNDGDGQVSVFEAWSFACLRVDGFYKERGRLATEHSVLEDTGVGKAFGREAFDQDGAFLETKEGVSVSPGVLARESVLLSSPLEAAMSAEERSKRAELETELRRLRGRKSDLTPEFYRGSLETIFLSLGGLYEETRKRMASEISNPPTPLGGK